jgi:hypothetical protein
MTLLESLEVNSQKYFRDKFLHLSVGFRISEKLRIPPQEASPLSTNNTSVLRMASTLQGNEYDTALSTSV